MSKISVVIATYNGEKYIKDQLKSIIDQTYSVDEIVICDDCSSDNTLSEINDFFNQVNINFKLIVNDNNQGVYASFKNAIEKTSGDIIFLCDQDDYWLNNKVSKFVEIFNNKEVGLVFSNAFITDATLNKIGNTLWDSLKYRPVDNNFELINEEFKRNVFAGMSMAFRRELIDANFWFSRNMLHDECIGWNALKKSKVFSLNLPLVLYRQHEDNVVGAKKFRKFETIDKTLFYVKKSIIRNYNKFNDIKKFFSNNPEVNKLLDEIIVFYKWRKDIDKKNFFGNINHIFLNSIKYKRFTGNSNIEKIKDIFCAFFYK